MCERQFRRFKRRGDASPCEQLPGICPDFLSKIIMRPTCGHERSIYLKEARLSSSINLLM
jgi:hypothetical protein